ncbi:MAG: type I-PGING CRISPR-associated protein Cas7/Csp1 [Bacteroidaceae bacterium]|nr:type I-PGING CRISPR-associated protein Cas7/Csp1 [Bacteroidaceae bacterium]
MDKNQTPSQKSIVGILVSLIAPFEHHIANGGEKLLGNASSIKRRPDGKVYVSGQMQRHVFFSALKRLNELEKKEYALQKSKEQGNGNNETEFDITKTFVSNADGISEDITHDLRADLGGYMHTQSDTVSERRTGALSVTVAVAKEDSKVKNDLINRVAIKPDTNPTLATKEFSEHDDMIMNFYLDLNALSVTEVPNYPEEHKGWNVSVDYNSHGVDAKERKRRAKLFLQATSLMNDYANQSRNAVCGEPEKVVIVFDTIASRKASRYLTASEEVKEKVQKNIKEELKARGAKLFDGDDKTDKSVHNAYKEALEYLETVELYSPATNNMDNQNA